MFPPSLPKDNLNVGFVATKNCTIGINTCEGYIHVAYEFKDDFLFEEKKPENGDTFRNLVLAIANDDIALKTKLLKVNS